MIRIYVKHQRLISQRRPTSRLLQMLQECKTTHGIAKRGEGGLVPSNHRRDCKRGKGGCNTLVWGLKTCCFYYYYYYWYFIIKIWICPKNKEVNVVDSHRTPRNQRKKIIIVFTSANYYKWLISNGVSC